MATDLDQVVYSEQILTALRNRSIIDLIATRDQDAQFNFSEGGTEDTVEITVVDSPSTIGYDPAGDGFASGPERPSNTTKTLAVDHYSGVYQVYDALENAIEYVENFTEDGVDGLIEDANRYVLKAHNDAKSANQVSYDPGNDDLVTKLEEGEQNLSNERVPQTGRFMVVTPSIMSGIRGDLVTEGFNLADRVIQSPFFQGVWHGFAVFQQSADMFEVTGSSTQYRHCLMGHTSAIRYADTLRGPVLDPASGRIGTELKIVHAAAKEEVRPEALVDFRIKQ